MDIRAVEQMLSKSSYAEVAQALADYSDEGLLSLVAVKSNRVADTAADLLDARGKHDALIEAILNSTIPTALGKIRATSILHRWGRRLPRAEEAYLALLFDRSPKVIDNALFGLVFLQNRQNIPRIEDARQHARREQNATGRFDKAIEALAKGDPSIFSPHFHDSNNVWGIDRSEKRTIR